MSNKSILKLNEEAPTQHKLLLGAVAVIIFLSIVDAFKSPSIHDDTVLELKPGESRYVNPELSWYEKIFCSGYQRSLKCQNRFLHPMRAEFEAEGKVIKEGPPRSDGVVLYRGHLKGDKRGLGGRIQLDID